MAMFEDLERRYTSISQSSCPSLSGTSVSGSFSSSWDTACTTPPPSTRHHSFDAMKLQDLPYCTDNSPREYESSTSMSSMPILAFETVPAFHEHDMWLPQGKMLQSHPIVVGGNSFTTFNNQDFATFQSFHSNHGVSANTPPSDTSLCSPLSMDFVNPSQTTFHDSFDCHSPMPPLLFSSPASDRGPNMALDRSPMDNMSISLPFEGCASVTTTPSRTPSVKNYRASGPRGMLSGLAWTSAELQKVQSVPVGERSHQNRVRRDVAPSGKRAHNAPIQTSSKHPCLFPSCNRRFKRSEHLKRHERIHNQRLCPSEICPFCGHEFKGGRGDNLNTHVGLHDKPDSKRTQFHPGAKAWLAQRREEKGKKGAKSRIEKSSRAAMKMNFLTRSRVGGY